MKRPPQSGDHGVDSIEALLKASLEALCHQILYLRRVYPKESFTPKVSIFGIGSCHASRHPGVVQYIADTLEQVVKAILAGLSEEIHLVLLTDTTEIAETYILNVKQLGEAKESFGALERCLRDVLLGVNILDGSKTPKWGDDASFQIKLRTVDAAPAKSSSLQKDLGDANWCSAQPSPQGRYRQIHMANFEQCVIDLGMINHVA